MKKPIDLTDVPEHVATVFQHVIPGVPISDAIEATINKQVYYFLTGFVRENHTRTLIIDAGGNVHKSHPVDIGFIFDPTPAAHDVLGHIIVDCSGKVFAEGADHKCPATMQGTPHAVHAAGWKLSRNAWKCPKCMQQVAMIGN